MPDKKFAGLNGSGRIDEDFIPIRQRSKRMKQFMHRHRKEICQQACRNAVDKRQIFLLFHHVFPSHCFLTISWLKALRPYLESHPYYLGLTC